MEIVHHKAGTTYIRQGTEDFDLTNVDVKSHIRRYDGTLMEILDFTLLTASDVNSTYTLKKVDTSAWKQGTYLCDVRYEFPDGTVTASPTYQLIVEPATTR